MSDIFITSDEHYGHARIIELANRPFTSVEEMTETIIERHNKVVPRNPNILTIHVGDMFWQTLTSQEAVSILIRLNGSHAFLYGNHDELVDKPSILKGLFDWVKGENKAGGAHLINFNKRKITLNHYAQRVWEGSHKGHWHVYGHSHNGLAGLGKSFDIGVDGHNFTPWSLEEIEAKMATLPQHHVIDNTGAGSVDTQTDGLNVYRGKAVPKENQ
jgi:calcineurin-like phosphoesterase family protein